MKRVPAADGPSAINCGLSAALMRARGAIESRSPRGEDGVPRQDLA